MPLSVISELLIRFVFETVLYVLGYITGALLVPAFSFGRYTVEEIPPPTRTKSTTKTRRESRLPPRTISADTAVFIGMLFWVLLIIAAYFLWRVSDA